MPLSSLLYLVWKDRQANVKRVMIISSIFSLQVLRCVFTLAPQLIIITANAISLLSPSSSSWPPLEEMSTAPSEGALHDHDCPLQNESLPAWMFLADPSPRPHNGRTQPPWEEDQPSGRRLQPPFLLTQSHQRWHGNKKYHLRCRGHRNKKGLSCLIFVNFW